jgi:hypothetical protein
MKIAYIVGEKIFEDKEEAQIYEQKENQYNEIIEKYPFDEQQRNEIKFGIEKGLDVSWYARPEFNWMQMEAIREGLQLGLNVEIYAKNYFSYEQMGQIAMDLKKV